MNANPEIARLARAGFHFPGAVDMLTPEITARIAQDADPAIVTTPNSGIPTYLNTYVDPELVDVVFAPNRAVEIIGDEVQKGDWVTPTAVFIQTENTGEVSTYGDFNANGVTGVNPTFEDRQNYLYQTIVNYGDRESAEYGLARINLANEKRKSATLVLNKFQNVSYFNGVANLKNYGLLNDPSLSTALTAAAAWGDATSGTDIYNDVKALFHQLQTQTEGLIDMDDEMTLALSPTKNVYLNNVATVGSSSPTGIYSTARQLIKDNFPRITIRTAPQYTTGSGELMQLIAKRLEGHVTAQAAYSEKLRAHRIEQRTSSFLQKLSQGTFGTIIYRPLAIAQMLGI